MYLSSSGLHCKRFQILSGQLERHILVGREKERDHRRSCKFCSEGRPVIHIRPYLRFLVCYTPAKTSKISLNHFFLPLADAWILFGSRNKLFPADSFVEGVSSHEAVDFCNIITDTFSESEKILLAKAFFQHCCYQANNPFIES